ncbi:MAG: hypothetical protein AAFZ74_07295 [Pseudomonadota bacterium]
MRFLFAFRVLLLSLASLGYFANGAQAHVKVQAGETLQLMLCSVHSSNTVEVELPSAPIEETEDTCCGDCTASLEFRVVPPVSTLIEIAFKEATPPGVPEAVSPRSPLWPGAPPNGPPLSHRA